MVSSVLTPHPARRRPLLIGIDGRSGAGKTTLATELAAHLRSSHSVSLFHLEDLYPGWDGLRQGITAYTKDVAQPLASGQRATWSTWDWIKNVPGPDRQTEPAEIVILEGVGACAAQAREFLDIAVWVQAEAGTRKDRAMGRDGETYAPFWDMWAAQESEWLARDDVKSAADLQIRGGADGLALSELLTLLSHHPDSRHLAGPDEPRLGSFTDCGPGDGHVIPALLELLPDAVWLDSSDAGLPGTTRNRFSILAAPAPVSPVVATHESGWTSISVGASSARFEEPFFAWLDAAWHPKSVDTPSGFESDFTLGWVGWLGYELKRETGGSDVAPHPGVPDAALLLAERAVVLDHQTGHVWALELASGSPASTHDGGWVSTVRAALEHGVKDEGRSVSARQGPDSHPVPRFSAADSAQSYMDKVSASKDQIREGNSYEICLTTGLSATVHGFDPSGTYADLRKANPAPFAAFINLGGVSVLSTSPERFLSVSPSGAMLAEPIKGTRRRALRQDGSVDAEADAQVKAELSANLKDRAENVMIVDLLRNDLSHHAVPGSVEVTRLCDIESYATVHQMVSSITATLPPHVSRVSAVATAFPAGSMTGAPKISTMSILDGLETGPRGIYSGALGYFSLNGAVDLSVVIRTLVGVENPDGTTRLSLGVGGAVTADSTPEGEYDEIRAKAYGVLRVLGSEFPG